VTARKVALLVGTTDYKADPGLRKLVGPALDTERLGRALGNPDIGGFDDVQVLTNEPSGVVGEALEGLLADRDRDDLVLLYFSGHGVKDYHHGYLYLALTNTKLNRLGSTALAAQFINDAMLRSPSRQQVLMLDCCYSGAFARGMTVKAGEAVNTPDYFRGQGRAILTASDAMQYALEGESAVGTGIQSRFTSILVDGLENGAADLDGDGQVELEELYDYVLRRMREEAPSQKPNKIMALSGKLYLARNPNPPAPKPAPLPKELLDELSAMPVSRRIGAVIELERLMVSREPLLALAARQALERVRDDEDQIRRVCDAAAQALARNPPAARTLPETTPVPGSAKAEPPPAPASPPAAALRAERARKPGGDNASSQTPAKATGTEAQVSRTGGGRQSPDPLPASSRPGRHGQAHGGAGSLRAASGGPPVKLGVIGHVEHGKTTLTAAITKVLALTRQATFRRYDEINHAPEDAAAGIRINLARVEYQTASRQYAHVDGQGHGDIVKAMITGAAQMDGAILVVAANDGPLPQTREELTLARQIGVPAVVVFLNKVDLMADPEFLELIEMELRELLQANGYPGDTTPIVGGSALQALESASKDAKAPEYTPIRELLRSIDEHIPTPAHLNERPFLMPVEDVFFIKGRGTVTTGLIERGRIAVGDPLELVGVRKERVTAVCAGMERFHEQLDEGKPGENVGVLLSGVERKQVERGMVLAKPGSVTAHATFEAEVYWLKKEEGGRSSPVFPGYRPQFFIRTLEVTGTIKLLGSVEMVMPGDNTGVIVELVAPAALESGDRFSIRDGGRTVGLGVVTRCLES
jgi:elongation factor Tu